LWSGLSDREVVFLLDRAHGTDEILITAMHVVTLDASDRREEILETAAGVLPNLPPERRVIPARLPRRSRWLPVALAAAMLLFLLPARGPRIVGDLSPVQAAGERLQERLDALEEQGAELPADLTEDFEALVEDMLGDELDEM